MAQVQMSLQCQMIQFFCALFQMVYLNFTDDCNFPSWMIKTNIAYQISFIFLFGNFYIQSYMTKKPSSKKSSNGVTNGINSNNNNGIKKD